MGAKYVPSLVNQFMAKCEEDVIYTQQRPQVVMWARYIDDVFLQWDGSCSEIQEYIKSLNSSDRGIYLNNEASQKEICFLDLKITIKEDRFAT